MQKVTDQTPAVVSIRRGDKPAREIAVLLTDLFGPAAPREFAERLPGNVLAQRIAAAQDEIAGGDR